MERQEAEREGYFLSANLKGILPKPTVLQIHFSDPIDNLRFM